MLCNLSYWKETWSINLRSDIGMDGLTLSVMFCLILDCHSKLNPLLMRHCAVCNLCRSLSTELLMFVPDCCVPYRSGKLTKN